MKKTLSSAIVVLILLAVILAIAPNVYAEEPDNTSSMIDERCYQSYNEYVYPSGCRMFYLPRWHEYKFDVHNGKFFEVKAFPYYGNELCALEEEESLNLAVYFYTPAGQLIGIRKIGRLDKNRVQSIPHNDRSLCYDRLIVKVENNSNTNEDFAFKVVDPVDSVKGNPIKGASYSIIFR